MVCVVFWVLSVLIAGTVFSPLKCLHLLHRNAIVSAVAVWGAARCNSVP